MMMDVAIIIQRTLPIIKVTNSEVINGCKIKEWEKEERAM